MGEGRNRSSTSLNWPKLQSPGDFRLSKLHSFEQVVKVGKMVKTNYIGFIGDCREPQTTLGAGF